MTHFIFDCDDVLLDWETAFAGFCFLRGYNPNMSGPTSWDLSEWIGCSPSRAKALIAEFNQSPEFATLHARPHARQLLWALHEVGHTISILTSCGEGQRTQTMRVRNLANEFGRRVDGATHLPHEDVDMLPLGSLKFDFLYAYTRNRDPADMVFVEDNFTHARAGLANGIKSYCLRRSHNRAQEAEHPDTAVIWINDIADLGHFELDDNLLAKVF